MKKSDFFQIIFANIQKKFEKNKKIIIFLFTCARGKVALFASCLFGGVEGRGGERGEPGERVNGVKKNIITQEEKKNTTFLKVMIRKKTTLSLHVF